MSSLGPDEESVAHRSGYVLSRWERGESDLSVELLLTDGELLRSNARRARKSQTRFPGGLSPFIRYRFYFQPERRGASQALTEAALEHMHTGVLTGLHRTMAAGIATSLVREFALGAGESGWHCEHYAGLLSLLETADEPTSGAELLRYLFALLEESGRGAVFDHCVRCQRSVPANARVRVCVESGGVLCSACGQGTLVLSSSERLAIEALLAGENAAFRPPMLLLGARLLEPMTERGARALREGAGHWGVGPSFKRALDARNAGRTP